MQRRFTQIRQLGGHMKGTCRAPVEATQIDGVSGGVRRTILTRMPRSTRPGMTRSTTPTSGTERALPEQRIHPNLFVKHTTLPDRAARP